MYSAQEEDLLGIGVFEASQQSRQSYPNNQIVLVQSQQQPQHQYGDVLTQYQSPTKTTPQYHPRDARYPIKDQSMVDLNVQRHNTMNHQQCGVPVFSTYSILDDRTFAPPPPLPSHEGIIKYDFMTDGTPFCASASLPKYERIMHSGSILARISIKSLVTKTWKEVFWIIYGSTRLIFFRTKRDYEEWAFNPVLNADERNLLIKLKIDLEKDLSINGIRGYNSTNCRPKEYRRRGVLYNFKIDSMTKYGPSLVGAFASKDKREVMNLHSLFGEMMKRSPLNSNLLRMSFSKNPINMDSRERRSRESKFLSYDCLVMKSVSTLTIRDQTQ